MSNDQYENTIHWGNTGANSDNYIIQQPKIEDEQIYYNDTWKIPTTPPDHNHSVKMKMDPIAPVSFTYNDDSVKMDGIIDVIDEMLTALKPMIDIGSMKKISDKLILLRDTTSHWHMQPINDVLSKPKEQKIKLDEELFEI